MSTQKRRLENLLLLVVIVAVGGALGYAAYRASGGGASAEPDPPAGDVLLLSQGDEVDIEAQRVPGKYTIYDFYADWCPPCRVLDVSLRQIAATHENVAVRKIDIIDWTTPVVDQYGVTDLPHMILYGPDGKKLAEGDDVYPLLKDLFDVEVF